MTQDPSPTRPEPVTRPERPAPFESPLLHPMSPKDQTPEGGSILTLIPKLPPVA